MRADTCSGCWAAGDGTLKTQSKAGSCAAAVSKKNNTTVSRSSPTPSQLPQASFTHVPEGDFASCKPASRSLPECKPRYGTSAHVRPPSSVGVKEVNSDRQFCRAHTSAADARAFDRRGKSFATSSGDSSTRSERTALPKKCQNSPLSTAAPTEEGQILVKTPAAAPTDKEGFGNSPDRTVAKTEVGRVKIGVEEFRRLLYAQMCKTKNASDLFIEVNSVEATQAALQKYDVDMDKLGSVYPSVGALLHDEGYCIPCAFASKNNKSCHNGVSCCFCHYFHREVLVRRRGKKKRSHNSSGAANHGSEVV